MNELLHILKMYWHRDLTIASLIIAVLSVALGLSITYNVYLWDKWQYAQIYVSAKCQVSEGSYPVLIANDYHYCWRVKDNGHKL